MQSRPTFASSPAAPVNSGRSGSSKTESVETRSSAFFNTSPSPVGIGPFQVLEKTWLNNSRVSFFDRELRRPVPVVECAHGRKD